jgi:type II secretory pathway pseudopilin PulG
MSTGAVVAIGAVGAGLLLYTVIADARKQQGTTQNDLALREMLLRQQQQQSQQAEQDNTLRDWKFGIETGQAVIETVRDIWKSARDSGTPIDGEPGSYNVDSEGYGSG